MKKILYTTIIVFLSLATMPLMSQKLYKGYINISSTQMQREGDSLYIHIKIHFSDLKIDKNRTLALTPILTNDYNEMHLFPCILLNGTLRDKAYRRSQALGGEKYAKNAYAVVKVEKAYSGQIDYMYAVAYKEWMDKCSLDMEEMLCACAGHDKEVKIDRLFTYVSSRPQTQTQTPYNVELEMAYIHPQIEYVKNRYQQREIYLDFPVNQTNILPDYMNNAKELAVVENMLMAVKSDNNLTVNSIDIIGYASPEGYVGNNDKLAKGRADAFRSYLASKLYYPQRFYNTRSGGENWNGLIAALETSDMSYSNTIIGIIRNTSDLATRKTMIKDLDEGIPYNYMLYNIYPKLRKVVAIAHYTVRGFDVEEAKVIFSNSPQQLSLIEMFNIANTYKQGDEDFIEVFEVAVRMFPNDATANLNAAAAELSSQNTAKAKKYLDKVNKNTPEYVNNLGVFYFQIGDLEQATLQFQKAAATGLNAAKHNLLKIQNKKKHDASFK